MIHSHLSCLIFFINVLNRNMRPDRVNRTLALSPHAEEEEEVSDYTDTFLDSSHVVQVCVLLISWQLLSLIILPQFLFFVSHFLLLQSPSVMRMVLSLPTALLPIDFISEEGRSRIRSELFHTNQSISDLFHKIGGRATPLGESNSTATCLFSGCEDEIIIELDLIR